MDPEILRALLQAKDYRMIRVLGSGGFGLVCLAVLEREAGFRLPRAIKIFTPREVEPRALEIMSQQFVEEARVLASFQHDHIVKVLDFFQLADSYCLVMEYVEGFTLSTLLDWRRTSKEGPFSEKTVLTMLAQACAGLAHAHGATDRKGRPLDLLHCDLKPANLMLAQNGRIQILDFGVATSRAFAQQELLFGTPAYMSPEQASGGPMHRCSDLYSLAMVCYELLTLQSLMPPISQEMNEKMSPEQREAFQRARLETARTLDVTPALNALSVRQPNSAALLRWMLQPQLSQRPQSATEVLEQVMALLRQSGPALLEPFYQRECQEMRQAGRTDLLPLTWQEIRESLPSTVYQPAEPSNHPSSGRSRTARGTSSGTQRRLETSAPPVMEPDRGGTVLARPTSFSLRAGAMVVASTALLIALYLASQNRTRIEDVSAPNGLTPTLLPRADTPSPLPVTQTGGSTSQPENGRPVPSPETRNRPRPPDANAKKQKKPESAPPRLPGDGEMSVASNVAAPPNPQQPPSSGPPSPASPARCSTRRPASDTGSVSLELGIVMETGVKDVQVTCQGEAVGNETRAGGQGKYRLAPGQYKVIIEKDDGPELQFPIMLELGRACRILTTNQRGCG